MATITAQFLIGDSHIYHDGIIPTHYLFLTENDKPYLILVHENLKKPVGGRIVWIPTIENMMKDALLMISAYIIKDPEIIQLMNKHGKIFDNSPMELYSHFSKENLALLYDKLERVQKWPKIVVTVLQNSSIKAGVKDIANYPIPHEICLSDDISVK